MEKTGKGIKTLAKAGERTTKNDLIRLATKRGLYNKRRSPSSSR